MKKKERASAMASFVVVFVETIIQICFDCKWPGFTFWCVNEVEEVNVIKQIIMQCVHDVLPLYIFI